MKFEDFNSVSTGIPGAYRFAPFEIVLRIEGLRRWLQIFIFGQGFEIIWSRKCHCLGCMLSRARAKMDKKYGEPTTDEELLDSLASWFGQSWRRRAKEALTQAHYRESRQNEKETTRS